MNFIRSPRVSQKGTAYRSTERETPCSEDECLFSMKKACQLAGRGMPRDKENHEQREDSFSTQRNREPGPQELDPGHRGKTHVTSLQELERD